MFTLHRAVSAPRRAFHLGRTTTNAWRWEAQLPTESDAAPTLESIDALRPQRPRRQHEFQSQQARALWDNTFKRMQGSFTRTQLYQLAKEASLRDIRTSLSKADLVRAFLVQRFALRDPAAIVETSAFLPLDLSEVFLLARSGRGLFRTARNAYASVSIEKQGHQTGAMVRGSDSAIESVRQWLNEFHHQIHCSEVQLKAVPPVGLLHHIAEVSGCYMEREDNTARLRFLDATAAHTASILLEQHACSDKIAQLLCFGVPGNRLTALPFAPGTLTSVEDAYAMRSEHVRYTAPPDVAPLFHFDENEWEQLQIAAQPAPIPVQLLDSEWKKCLSLSFGHAVYPADMAPVTSAVDELGEPRFLPNAPPSCMGSQKILGPYTPLPEAQAEKIRFHYRADLQYDPVDLILTLQRNGSKIGFQSAKWTTSTSAHILCPTAPVDARVSIQNSAPANIRALRQTALDTYLQSIHAWDDEPYPGADAIAPDAHPHHAPLAPRKIALPFESDFLHLSLRRTELLDETKTTYHLENEVEPAFTLHQTATKSDAMNEYTRISSVRILANTGPMEPMAIACRAHRAFG